MKQSLLVGLVSLLSFVGGLAINSSSHAQKTTSNQNAPTALVTSTPTPCPAPDPFPRLIDDKYVTKFNGPKLPLYYNSDAMIEDVPFSIDSAKVLALTDGGLLVSLGNSLYRLDRHHHIVWRYYTAQMIFDYAYVQS